MISRSLYLSCVDDPVKYICAKFGIKAENALAYDTDMQDTDYSFFDRKENSVFYSNISGDFSVSCDINLFEVDLGAFDQAMMELSSAGLIVAVPDDESDSPFDYILYERGTKRNIHILDDEITDEVKINELPPKMV